MLRWYVIHSKPRKEAWVCNQFAVLKIDAFYPCYADQDSLASSKYKPYFPGYLFINVDIESTGMSVLQWIPGSLGLVSFGGEPAIVPDALIQKIRQQVERLNKIKRELREHFKQSDEITIYAGPFAGYGGIFDSLISGYERVRVFLKFLQYQQMPLELPVGQIALKR